MRKGILTLALAFCFSASVMAAEPLRLGVTVGGGFSNLAWDKAFFDSLGTAGFQQPTLAYSLYGGSEFRLNEQWLLQNLGQAFFYKARNDAKETKVTVGVWSLSALRLWEARPNFQLGAGARAGIGAFDLRLDYGEPAGDLTANVRELEDKFFVSLSPLVALRYQIGSKTLTMEFSYQIPLLLEQKLKSGLQIQAGLSYDLGY